MTETIQISETDKDALMELLDGVKTMLLSHERRLGIIEKTLVDAFEHSLPPNRRERRKIGQR